MRLDEFLAYLSDEPEWMDVERVDIMTRGSGGDTPLHAALWARDDEAARALIDAGADVNAMGEENYTPLHVAIAHKDVAMARYLAEHGASWDIKSEFGTSPLEEARRSDDAAVRALADEVAGASK